MESCLLFFLFLISRVMKLQRGRTFAITQILFCSGSQRTEALVGWVLSDRDWVADTSVPVTILCYRERERDCA